jgi:hypothetical protein
MFFALIYLGIYLFFALLATKIYDVVHSSVRVMQTNLISKSKNVLQRYVYTLLISDWD